MLLQDVFYPLFYSCSALCLVNVLFFLMLQIHFFHFPRRGWQADTEGEDVFRPTLAMPAAAAAIAAAAAAVNGASDAAVAASPDHK